MRNYDDIMYEFYGERYKKYRELYNSTLIEKLDFPIHLDIDLRDFCNLKCPACHNINRKRNNGLISKDLLYSIVEECKRNNLCSVNFGGCSEPLLDKEYLLGAIKAFKAAGVMDIFVHTNAILLDKEYSKELIDSGVTFICISIDAFKPETYNKVRGGDVSKIIENIENFIQMRNENNRSLPFVRVSFLPTEINIDELEAFEDFWKDKVDIVDIQDYTYIKNGPKPASENVEVDFTISNDFAIDFTRRMSIVAPNIMAKNCTGDNIEFSIKNNYTFNKFKTIKEFWDIEIK